jgi:ribonuclease Z
VKVLKYTLITTGLLLVGLWAGKNKLTDTIIRQIAERNFSIHRHDWLSDGKVHVVMIGTGSPAAEANVAQSCMGIIYDHSFIIFDAGGGSARKAEVIGLPASKLNRIFISHFHSDHILDIDAWQDVSWRGGRRDSLYIHGTPGISTIVAGFNQVLKADAAYRAKNITSSPDMAFAFGTARPFEVPSADSMQLVYEDPNGMRVFAFEVSHQPVDPAVGYRIEVNGKVIVYSGDTKKDLRMVKYARNADLLIHEAYNRNIMIKGLAYGEKLPPAQQDQAVLDQARQTPHYHTDPKEVAEIAQAAGVKQIVFTHVIPPLPSGIARKLLIEPMFTEGIRDLFGGKFVIARDGLHIAL